MNNDSIPPSFPINDKTHRYEVPHTVVLLLSLFMIYKTVFNHGSYTSSDRLLAPTIHRQSCASTCAEDQFQLACILKHYYRSENFSALQCIVVPAVQCSAVHCSAVQSSAIQCSAVQCSAVQWNADGEGHEGRRQLQSCKVRRVSWHPSPQYSQGSNQVLFNIRQENFRPFLRSSVTLMVPPLYSETGWAGELWPKTNLPKWPN